MKYRQPGPHCSLWVVFVGLGVAEVDEESIAQVLGDVAFKPAHGAGADLLVAADNITEDLGV